MQDHNRALNDLIERVNAADNSVCSIAWDELQPWQTGLLAGFESLGLLRKDVNSQSLICKGCEQHCFMPVALTDDAKRAFIVCDDPYQQEDMGRIKIPLERLQQWQASARQFAVCIANLLGLSAEPERLENTASLRLGILKGAKGRRWVTLQTQPLALEANGNAAPLAEVLYFEGDTLHIDQARVDELLNTAPTNTGKAYVPDISKREARRVQSTTLSNKT